MLPPFSFETGREGEVGKGLAKGFVGRRGIAKYVEPESDALGAGIVESFGSGRSGHSSIDLFLSMLRTGRSSLESNFEPTRPSDREDTTSPQPYSSKRGLTVKLFVDV